MDRFKYFYLFIFLFLTLISCDIRNKKENKILIPDASESFNKEVKKEYVIPADEIKEIAKQEVIVDNKAVENVTTEKEKKNELDHFIKNNSENIQDRIIKTAEKYLYVRETKGKNRSPEIDKWNLYAGFGDKSFLGAPYCSSSLSFLYREELGLLKTPRTAYSPSMVNKNNVKFKDIKKGDIGGLFFTDLDGGRIGHVLIVNEPNHSDSYVSTIEFNTSPSSSYGSKTDREGEGGYKKIRNKKLLSQTKNKFSRYWE